MKRWIFLVLAICSLAVTVYLIRELVVGQAEARQWLRALAGSDWFVWGQLGALIGLGVVVMLRERGRTLSPLARTLLCLSGFSVVVMILFLPIVRYVADMPIYSRAYGFLVLALLCLVEAVDRPSGPNALAHRMQPN